jgi:uncharacterized membrane protein YgcG
MPQIPSLHSATREAFSRIPSPSLSLFALFIILSVWSSVTLAEVRVVTAQGEHQMGDRDTREDAIRLATERAKRNALEQVATYLESITIVDGMDVTKDEIRTYTAGIVLVLDQQTSTSLDGETIVITVDLVTQVDTEEVAHAIVALRENEDARHQLVALQQEMDQLHSELDAANQALQQASTAEQVQQATQQRQDILNRAQSNAMVSQVWTDWALVSPVAYPYPWIGGSAQTHALLNGAQTLYPTSPYVPIAQQVVTTRQPPPSTQSVMVPSKEPGPHRQPGTRPVPLTLNEISHLTSTAPSHIGNQSTTIQPATIPTQPGSRNFTDVRQLNPLLPAPSQNTRSAQALRQFLQSPQAGQPPTGQPPISRRLAPTINQIHPPQSYHVPHAPFGARSFSGGGGMGRGRGGGWAGGRGGGGRGGGRGR